MEKTSGLNNTPVFQEIPEFKSQLEDAKDIKLEPFEIVFYPDGSCDAANIILFDDSGKISLDISPFGVVSYHLINE